MKLIINIILLFAFLFLTTKTANAYLDPGSGSFIFQIIVGALLGSLVMIKLFFNKLKLSITKLFLKQKKNGGDKKTNYKK